MKRQTGTIQKAILDKEILCLPEIILYFGLGKIIDSPIVLKGGIANHNYLVKVQTGALFVVKVLVNQTIDSVKNEVEIQGQLRKAGLRSTLFIQNRDGCHLFYRNGIHAVVSSRIDGVHPEIVNATLAYAIGKALARFHLAVNYLPVSHEGWLNINEALRVFSQVPEDSLSKGAKELIDEGKSVYSQELPTGITHGDLCTTNLFVEKVGDSEVTAIFDLEEAGENLLLIDLARSVIASCSDNSGRRLSPNLVRAMLDGYSEIRKLTGREILAFRDAIKYTAGVCALWFLKNRFLVNAGEQIERGKNFEWPLI